MMSKFKQNSIAKRCGFVPLSMGLAALVFTLIWSTSTWVGATENQASLKSQLPSERLYEQWKAGFKTAGGDKHVIIRLGPIRGLSLTTKATGIARLNLIKSTITVTLTGNDEAYDIWLDIPADGGFAGQNLDQFNFDSDDGGINDSFGNCTFNIPPLVEAADTPLFFHTTLLTPATIISSTVLSLKELDICLIVPTKVV